MIETGAKYIHESGGVLVTLGGESVNNNATYPGNSTWLRFRVAANARYIFRIHAMVTPGANTTGIRMRFSQPGGLLIDESNYIEWDDTGIFTTVPYIGGVNLIEGGVAVAAGRECIIIFGSFATVTSGLVIIQFGQTIARVVNTTLEAGSILEYARVG